MKSKLIFLTSILAFFASGCGLADPTGNGTSARQLRIPITLKENPPAVDVRTLKTLASIIVELAAKKIVYVGEEHDKYSHHQVQLEILRGLYQQNPKIAVGMEMFQRPFQKALDDYIEGRVDERVFLKESEYFKRWNIDYNLYKPILDFARAHRLPVIALNARQEIVSKVAKGGLESLTIEEKQQIAQDLDFSDGAYRARLREVFGAHKQSQEKDFEFFYQAQIVWDETMAESIDRFLKANPDYQIVVFTGGGHLQYGSGIPKRVFRRNHYEYSTVLNDADVKPGIADFIVFPEPAKAPTAPTLGVLLEEQKQGLRITGFTKDSIAERAGLKIGDILIALDEHPLSSSEDLRIALFYKRPGDTISLRTSRGNEDLQFKLLLEPTPLQTNVP